jgi:UDP-N-acetylmuramoyl-L-alanyl-D-glutamate--2,6-diaminopimelate ligase
VGSGVGGIGGSSTSSSGIRAIGPIFARATSVRVEHDRARAITSTLDAAAAGDAVLIAGKGHESYQIYGTEKRPFSDQAVIRNYLKEEA